MWFEYYCQYYPEILTQARLKQETKIDGEGGHAIFFNKITGPWNEGPLGYDFFEKILKLSSPPSNILNVCSLITTLLLIPLFIESGKNFQLIWAFYVSFKPFHMFVKLSFVVIFTEF